MAGVFGGSVGPVGSNISDYTSLPNAPGMQGMGPIASGQQYGQFLQSQQPTAMNKLGSSLNSFGEAYGQMRGAMQPQQQMQFMPMQQQRQPVQLQQANLMDFLSMLGGR